jgi:hypothetical protein
METLGSVAKWLFFDSIYGIVLIAVLTYGIFWAIKRAVPKTPNPAIFAVVVSLLGLFTLPSVPRYQFEREVASQIEGKAWIRVVNQTRWGTLTEPLTLVATPVGSFTLVMPNNPITGGFREVLMRYGEETMVSMVEPECEDYTVLYARPDPEGVFRYTTMAAQKMTKLERETYCQHDWTREREALRAEMLRGMEARPAGRR